MTAVEIGGVVFNAIGMVTDPQYRFHGLLLTTVFSTLAIGTGLSAMYKSKTAASLEAVLAQDTQSRTVLYPGMSEEQK